MARILAIDYGKKRTGIAVTDPLQIIATGLDTIATENLITWLQAYVKAEEVERIIVGDPKYPDGNPAQLAPEIHLLAARMTKLWPSIPIMLHDESYSSVRAKELILQSGAKQKKRRDKALVDKIAALVILQDYLGY